MRRALAICAVVVSLGTLAAVPVLRGLGVGERVRGGVVVPTGAIVKAEGRTTMVPGGTVDMVVSADERYAFIKQSQGVSLIRLSDGKVVARDQTGGGTSLTGVALSPDGKRVAASTAHDVVVVWSITGEKLEEVRRVKLPAASVGGEAYPCGLAYVSPTTLLVAANRDNSLLVVDTDSGEVVKRVAVDPAPYSVLAISEKEAFVSCWAGTPRAGKPTAMSSGTPVEVDHRGTTTAGSVCRVDLTTGQVLAKVSVPAQPTEMAVAAGRLYVACSGADVVVGLDAKSLRATRTLRTGTMAGTAPNSLTVDGERLLVAFGGLDRVAAFRLKDGKLLGLMQTAWYPSVVRTAGRGLLVATAKGIGSRGGAEGKRSVGETTGTVSYVAEPKFDLKPEAALREARATRAKAVPVPARTGEPSAIEHVVYVIKENRTYDQVLGDMKQGDGDPKLTMYGEEVTPNHHALAAEFALLDNYYCNGINSADGHAWTTEANATTYFERAHGGWTRSYPFGDDPLATSQTGHIWDNALEHGKTVRNFGEYDYASPAEGRTFAQIYASFQKGEVEKFTQNIGVARVRSISEADYPGWNLSIPDVLRADRFVRRLREYERAGDFPNLTIVYLPQDHTSGASGGMPTPRAHVADNDLALGRVVEAISRSRFWAKTAIFVIEDDPQDGFDHVDGHRSVCLVVSPYSRGRGTVSEFYNQTSVLHTMERILGLPPMNRNDALAPLMTACFGASPDLRPYEAKPARVPLDELNKRGGETAMRLDKPDQVKAGQLNRTLWSLSGKASAYPSRYEGAHGRGLAKRGLRLAGAVEDDD